MITVKNEGMFFYKGALLTAADGIAAGLRVEDGKRATMTYSILEAHNTTSSMDALKLRFDAMASHDITYVGIIQTARASGLTQFPLPYVLTNCHNSLCAVGGTINEDDHVFGLSAAKRYGGEFVPAHQAVIHSYMREMYAGGGRMILGSDSHTRYGAYGTMAIGEGGPELVKQLLQKTYDIAYPRVVGIHVTGAPRIGVGPQDVALALIGATFKQGYVKNSVMEFFGSGIAALAMDYRNGIDVMTTETSCLSSVWQTDETVKLSLAAHGRAEAFRLLAPQNGAYYDAVIELDLSRIEPMIALPFHPSNTYTIAEFNENLSDILHAVDEETLRILSLKKQPQSLLSKVRGGKFYADQGVIAGCSGGTYQNLVKAAEILRGQAVGSENFWLSCYPASQPVMMELLRTGELTNLMAAGVSIRTAFCGPCFGAGDVPANGAFSIRHSTRNFPNREGAKPGDGQLAYVALMDARSIAASAINGGAITPATDLAELTADPSQLSYRFDASPYSRVYRGVGKPDAQQALVFGPNIADWPEQIPMPENLLMYVASAIYDPVTTTDELIPSGETSSYRSNPMKLSEFTLSRKDPAYVGRAKDVRKLEILRRENPDSVRAQMQGYDPETTGIGSVVMSIRPGDGSAREQAASCQRVLGGVANLCEDFSTKRYRSNVINWGMLPFTVEHIADFAIAPGDRLYVPGIRAALLSGAQSVTATLIQGDAQRPITLKLERLTQEDRDIILSGCLINYYAK
ncbi:MAG: hydratase [Oscillospiraceae bacterium]|jgi:aconitate hydratase|nr:hydratase [Oscillospiraceae bacterium]